MALKLDKRVKAPKDYTLETRRFLTTMLVPSEPRRRFTSRAKCQKACWEMVPKRRLELPTHALRILKYEHNLLLFK